MNYKEAWTFLDNLQFFKIKLGLDSMTMFLEELDRPQDQLRFVHIAGTNGKGSVGVTLLTIMAKAGYRVGLYTSPHLSSVRERFRINEQFISIEDFAREATEIHTILAGRQITYFEFTTALALLWFARIKVDLAIMEVGLGGRLDATNVITPLVSVITNVSMDHEAYLGTTLSEIAGEKAGIIKPGVPVVSGVEKNPLDQNGVGQKVIENVCSVNRSVLYKHGVDFFAEPEDDSTWNYWGMKRKGCCRVRETLSKLLCNLKGEHQIRNSGLALAVLELLEIEGFPFAESDIREGLAEVSWPGRLEYFCLSSLNGRQIDCAESDSKRYLLDGAHNPAGVQSLKRELENGYSYRHLILVWGAMSDKNLTETLSEAAIGAKYIILTKPESERSAKTSEMYEILNLEAQSQCICIPSVIDALAKGAELAENEDLIVIAGSLYLIGEAREILLGKVL